MVDFNFHSNITMFSGLITILLLVGCQGCLVYESGPKRQRVKEGESAMFLCSFRQSGSGNNYGRITWQRENSPLSGTRFVTSNKDEGDRTVSKLTIHNVSRTDGGRYRCVPSNPCPNSRQGNQATLIVFFFDTHSPLACPLPPEPGDRNDELRFRIPLPKSSPPSQVSTSTGIGRPILTYAYDPNALSVTVTLHEKIHDKNITFQFTNSFASDKSLYCTIGPFQVNSKPIIVMTSSSPSFDLGFVHEAIVNCIVLKAVPPLLNLTLNCQPADIVSGCSNQQEGSAKIFLKTQRVNLSVNHEVSARCCAENADGESEALIDIPIRDVTHLAASSFFETPQTDSNQYIQLSSEIHCTGSFATCSRVDGREISFDWYTNGFRTLPTRHQNGTSILDVSTFPAGTRLACETWVEGAVERAYGELSPNDLTRDQDTKFCEGVTDTPGPRYIMSVNETSTMSPTTLNMLNSGYSFEKLKFFLASPTGWISICSLVGISCVVIVLVKSLRKVCKKHWQSQNKSEIGTNQSPVMEGNVNEEQYYYEIVDDNPLSFVSSYEENDHYYLSPNERSSQASSVGTAGKLTDDHSHDYDHALFAEKTSQPNSFGTPVKMIKDLSSTKGYWQPNVVHSFRSEIIAHSYFKKESNPVSPSPYIGNSHDSASSAEYPSLQNSFCTTNERRTNLAKYIDHTYFQGESDTASYHYCYEPTESPSQQNISSASGNLTDKFSKNIDHIYFEGERDTLCPSYHHGCTTAESPSQQNSFGSNGNLTNNRSNGVTTQSIAHTYFEKESDTVCPPYDDKYDYDYASAESPSQQNSSGTSGNLTNNLSKGTTNKPISHTYFKGKIDTVCTPHDDGYEYDYASAESPSQQISSGTSANLTNNLSKGTTSKPIAHTYFEGKSDTVCTPHDDGCDYDHASAESQSQKNSFGTFGHLTKNLSEGVTKQSIAHTYFEKESDTVCPSYGDGYDYAYASAESSSPDQDSFPANRNLTNNLLQGTTNRPIAHTYFRGGNNLASLSPY